MSAVDMSSINLNTPIPNIVPLEAEPFEDQTKEEKEQDDYIIHQPILIKKEPQEEFLAITQNGTDSCTDSKQAIQAAIQADASQSQDENSSGEGGKIPLQQFPHRAKLYYSIRLQKFLLICAGCNSKFYDAIKFFAHLCDAEVIAQARKSLEDSIVADTSTLLLGDDNLWHCRICDKTFDRKNTLRKHEQAHVMNYPCEICSKVFKSPSNLREHMNTHTGERPFKCHICPAAFTRKWALTSHVRGHLGDKRYPCQYCEKKFLKGPQLKVHIRMVHTKEKPCQCELCGAHFYSTTLLNEHKKRHDNIRNYKCEQCGKTFYDKKQLTKHYISHSDERPFQCDVCQMAFQREGTLKAHMKVHSGVKDHICQLCGRGFAENYNLTKHLRSHANGKIKMKDSAVPPREPKKKGRKSKKMKEEEELLRQQQGIVDMERDIKPQIIEDKSNFVIAQDSTSVASVPNSMDTQVASPVHHQIPHPVFGTTNMLNIPNIFFQIPSHLQN